jgi:RNA polymerase sigma factor (sigma-70 family)
MNEVDEHLLDLIRVGDQQGWRQFLDRFQRRLLAFASKRVQPIATAEDLVQETFLSFLSSMEQYRGTGALESYLFQILRRRIIDHYRQTGHIEEFPICDFAFADSDPIHAVASDEPNASWYLRREEQDQAVFEALAAAISRLARNLQAGERFRDLEIAEGLFFAGRRNRELAAALEIGENEIAGVKRRLIGRLREDLQDVWDHSAHPLDDSILNTDLLIRVWESERPSCPKRTTLGKFTLGILPQRWTEYVSFHVETLGCSFCNANLDEFRSDSSPDQQDDIRERLFQSTIGFFAFSRNDAPF